MTRPFSDHHKVQTPSELLAIEGGLDALASEIRQSVDAGFEDRLVSTAIRSIDGNNPLRIVHPGHERRTRVMPVLRWGFASAAVLAIASAVVVFRQPAINEPDEAAATRVSSAAVTELDEIAAVWDLLDDESIASRVSSLHGQTSTLSESILGDWVPVSMNEDSM